MILLAAEMNFESSIFFNDVTGKTLVWKAIKK